MKEYVKGVIYVRKNDGDFAGMSVPVDSIEVTPDEFDQIINDASTDTPFTITLAFVRDEDGNLKAVRSA